MEPTTEAYDQALVDIGIALGRAHSRGAGETTASSCPRRSSRCCAPTATTSSTTACSARADRTSRATCERARRPTPTALAYNGVVNGQNVRVVTVETAVRARHLHRARGRDDHQARTRGARIPARPACFPGLLIALATLLIVWFGVKRGLWPLARLSDELKARSPRDLRPIDAAAAPEETRPLVAALNGLLEELAQARAEPAALPRQRRAPAAHAARGAAGAHRARARAADAARRAARSSSRCTRRRSAPRASPTSCSRSRAPSPAARGRLRTGQPAQRGRERGRRLGAPGAGARRGPRLRARRRAGAGRRAAAARGARQPRAQRDRVLGGAAAGSRCAPASASGAVVRRGGGRRPRHSRRRSASRVLERFYRVPGTPGTGSGLGLAIVREIAAGTARGIELARRRGRPRLPSCANISAWIASTSKCCAPPKAGARAGSASRSAPSCAPGARRRARSAPWSPSATTARSSARCPAAASKTTWSTRCASRAVAAQKPELITYGITNAEATRWGLPCGGTLELVMEPLGGRERHRRAARAHRHASSS